ncbi:protein FAR-RED IMPAIRED RESPONSE 1-like [Mercurialis annua]|uniref:protein FAR-RED IMPAIRED RESPONSE 1-like n=1 Tax=Mercurialis annua TaxID=3986 RepID=UPI00215FB177|nr:protein FAR-RED IMPAIRED RESPONSE 1-like [Mercurialis annua]
MRERVPVLQVNVEMLRHASKIYTPAVYKMFQDEYMKVLDCVMHRVDKSEFVTSYKVQCGKKDQEHLVSLEMSTRTVKCSCMKFTFVGILCAHALKVLNKKNIKQIPPQYIMKRWTRDAKVGTIKDNYSIGVGSTPQELIGKRYSSMSHNFREILTLASESEDMYEHACEDFIKLLKNLQEMKISSDPASLSNSKDDKISSSVICEVKTKATVGRPSKRIKGALEKRKKIKQPKLQVENSPDIFIEQNKLDAELQISENMTQEMAEHLSQNATSYTFSNSDTFSFTQLL